MYIHALMYTCISLHFIHIRMYIFPFSYPYMDCITYSNWQATRQPLQDIDHTYEGVMSHVCRSHVTRMQESWTPSTQMKEWCHTCMQESCHTHGRFIPHRRHGHHCRTSFTHIKESCETYEGVMWHIWRSRVTHMKESCHTYEEVMSHIWRSHVTHMKESCDTYEGVMSHIWKSHVTHIK